jgi:predicted TIM-barrel fold metal-dependent hydrolase
MKFIDPHIHLFDLSLGQYHWLKPENPPFWPDKKIINNNFSETDIYSLAHKEGIELYGYVHIEAGFNNESPWKEIEWLEENCKGTFKSVASIDLTLSPNEFLKQITLLLTYQTVVGCRHILDDSAIDILSHKNTRTNLRTLSDNQLSFELQMPVSNLGAIALLTHTLKKLPDLTIIIKHSGFPPHINNDNIENVEFSNWLTGLKILSEFARCAIKCSGWEMTNRNYEAKWCEQIINNCITTFGINRVMLSSNFPLCLFSHRYSDVWQYHSQLALNKEQIEQLSFKNAKYWYKF